MISDAQIIEILQRYAVHDHYRASAVTLKYAVFRKRADGSSELASEPMAHAEAQRERERLIAADIMVLIA